MTIVSFIFLCIGVASVVLAAHLIFFDWYEEKRRRETEAWQKQRLVNRKFNSK